MKRNSDKIMLALVALVALCRNDGGCRGKFVCTNFAQVALIRNVNATNAKLVQGKNAMKPAWIKACAINATCAKCKIIISGNE